VAILAPVESFLKEFGFKLTPELEKEKWVRRPFVPKENKTPAQPHRPAKTYGDVTR
jgi:hypothetical protein